MKLKTHGRYDYSALPRRKDYSWPGGKRLAVHFCLNRALFPPQAQPQRRAARRYKPQIVTYAARGYAWDHLDPALPKFDKKPPM